MAKTPRGKAFDEFEPDLDNDEVKQALDSERAVLSLKGKPVLHESGVIQFLAVKFALADGTFSTVLLDRLAASALTSLVDAANTVNWDGGALKPGSARH